MYHGDSSPQDQAADAAMKALYQQLDGHDLDADTPFNTAAGHRDLTHRIQAELSRVPQSAHVSREHERLLVSAHGTAGHHTGNLSDPASRGRLDREFSLNESGQTAYSPMSGPSVMLGTAMNPPTDVAAPSSEINWRELTERIEQARRLLPTDALEALRRVRELGDLAEQALENAVREARRQGKSWAEIAEYTNVPRQAAWRRWHARGIR